MVNICFVGSGAIATAIGDVIAAKKGLSVKLLSIEPDVIESINNHNINIKYFPNIKLNSNLYATSDKSVISESEIIFLAIPSSSIVNYVKENIKFFNKDAILVNLAKGFGDNHQTIVQCLEDICKNKIATLKGPTFAREIINKSPTGITLGVRDRNVIEIFQKIFEGTNIHLDYSEDIIGVEILSILKNIYAIALGIVDAHFNSPNLRFLLLTNALKEMKNILIQFGGKTDTIFHYCGFGDFGLTALNDLSRNRTLGLLIGKGFLTKDISDNILLEGKIAVNVFCEEISKKNSLKDFHIISELYEVFNDHYDISKFVNTVLK